jgi:uncharacterized protein (DUF2236 family)
MTAANAVRTPLGPGTVAWRIGGDRRVLLVAGYALLLQVAHPIIGAGVHDHSVFMKDPWGRLDRTTTSLLTTIFGGPRAVEEADRLRELHKAIKGVDVQGRRYHALNPEGYWWVHATVFQAIVVVEQWFGTPLPECDQRRLYGEWRRLGLVLGLREHQMQETLEEYRAYFDHMVETRLEDNETVRDLLKSLSMEDMPPPDWWFLPRGAWTPIRPLGTPFLYTTTLGLLPPVLRDRLGLDWTDADERRLRRIAALVRWSVSRLPDRLRLYPVAYRAKRRASGVMEPEQLAGN